ncbi:hypothetical protein BKP37_17570 [Anaerobacillus alkalilacustris]|uniref:CobW C-terminal domain-containing protein n=1 Tax=Anaerobacillus alkalilacustris TaxID=393763 RepID=A0A1S2LGX5_9BACI|nr:GTP-binding protein [Anaerobacillus alkalilacustris]OIJ10745.1 hypothetical protein BKP37_17570 [Anaerobacillus alkalilacustris]
MKKRVPTYIITGFLGSGKTTVLQHLLNYCRENKLKPAIVINEIGETNVEEHLFKDDHVLEMLNGCICCSIQSDFTKELHTFITSLSDNAVPDIILIEGTGIANPIEIVDALTEPLLMDKIDLFSVINVIDGSKYLEYQSIFSSTREVRNILKSQISISSFILLNKMDLINHKYTDKIRRKVEDLKKGNTPVIETSYGEVNIQEMLEKRVRIHRSHEKINLLSSSKCGCNHNHTCDQHAKVHHNHSFQAVKIDINRPIDRIDFEKWLKKLPKTMVRGKGIVNLTETAGLFQFQYSSNQLNMMRVKENLNTEPCLILIGVDLDSKAIEKSFYEKF